MIAFFGKFTVPKRKNKKTDKLPIVLVPITDNCP